MLGRGVLEHKLNLLLLKIDWLIHSLWKNGNNNSYGCHWIYWRIHNIYQQIRPTASHLYSMQCIWQGSLFTIGLIDPSHKSHNTSYKYRTMHHFITEMCIRVHIYDTKWCIVGYGAGTWWDLSNRSIPMIPTLKNIHAYFMTHVLLLKTMI